MGVLLFDFDERLFVELDVGLEHVDLAVVLLEYLAHADLGLLVHRLCRDSQIIKSLPCFLNGAKSEFEICFARST